MGLSYKKLDFVNAENFLTFRKKCIGKKPRNVGTESGLHLSGMLSRGNHVLEVRLDDL